MVKTAVAVVAAAVAAAAVAVVVVVYRVFKKVHLLLRTS